MIVEFQALCDMVSYAVLCAAIAATRAQSVWSKRSTSLAPAKAVQRHYTKAGVDAKEN